MDSFRYQDLNADKLAYVANNNLVQHVSWIQQRTTGMSVMNDSHLVLVDSGLPCDTFNIICRARMSEDTFRSRIRDAIDYFASVNRPFTWWVNPGDEPSELAQHLVTEGLHYADGELAMAADLTKLNLVDTSPNGLRVIRTQTSAQLQDFATVMAANWSPPDQDVLRFYKMAKASLLSGNSPLWLYVGYLGETPVACSEVTIGGGIAGLYNVCTLESYRRRGFGSAITLQPLLDAREQGWFTAILQASERGAGIYKQIGFEAFGQVLEYQPASA